MTEQQEERYITIREMFEEVLDNQEAQVFRFAYDGDLWAGTDKRPGRVTITLPRTIVDKNIKTLREFALFGIAIPTKVIKSLPEDSKNLYEYSKRIEEIRQELKELVEKNNITSKKIVFYLED